MFDKKEYTSVSDMLRDTLDDPKCVGECEKLMASRAVISSLMALRAAKNLSQADVAKKLGCSQSRVSKMEKSLDSDIRLGDFADYAEAVGFDINLVLIDRSEPLVQKIKYHAMAIQVLLDRMVKIAQKDNQIAQGVSGFFGEAFFNLLNILKTSADSMPTCEDGTPLVEIEVLGPFPRSLEEISTKGMASTKMPDQNREATPA